MIDGDNPGDINGVPSAPSSSSASEHGEADTDLDVLHLTRRTDTEMRIGLSVSNDIRGRRRSL